jgi:phosphoenolpyruvate-protein phosphotransferase (PTS system enzyme I)
VTPTGKPPQVLHGIAVSDGIAVGRAVVVAHGNVEVFRIPISEEQISGELERFRVARVTTLEEIARNRAGVGSLFGEELAAIFDAHALMLADPAFIEGVERKITEDRVNAEWAVHEISREFLRRFDALDDAYLRERGQDLDDVSRQLFRALQGIDFHQISEVEGDVVLVADDIVPSEAIRLGRENVVGFVIESGGMTSHTSIIARSLGIPAVAAVSGATAAINDEDPVIVDGRAGEVLLHPSAETLERYARVRQGLAKVSSAIEGAQPPTGPVSTRDGQEIELLANIDLPEELALLAPAGARGIGLYRSEFLYMETDPRLPTEKDHYRIYRRLLDAAAPHAATIRTYDLGGRKLAREMMHVAEDNPVLGLRGIRLTLARPEIFRVQLRALLRAGARGDLWIMAPMVCRLEEVRELRAMVQDVAAELRAEERPLAASYRLGAMVEVPAAAMIADLLARELDFLAIGTNDLIQYALAVDRNNRQVADLYQPLHPAILRMLRSVAAAGRRAGIPVSLCGEMAGDARLTPLLLGLGLRRLSAHPRALPRIARVARESDCGRCKAIADECCDLATAGEVADLLRREEVAARETPA